MFGIPPLSFASKSYPWATREVPIESQTQTGWPEILFFQNELVAPGKKLNQKIKMEKKGRSALDAGGKPSTWFPPGELVEQ